MKKQCMKCNRYGAIKRTLKYGLVGIIGTVIHFAILIIFVEWGNWHPVAGSVIGFIAALVVSFVINLRWTYASKSSGAGSFLKYVGVSVLGLVENTFIMMATVEWLHWPYWWGQILVIVIVPPSNYMLNTYWTFKLAKGGDR